MAKVSPYNITDLTQDWSSDINGDPFSGAAVQQFIKNYLGAIAKAAYFDSTSNKMYWFASEEKKEDFIENGSLNDVLFSTGMDFSAELYRIVTTNNNGSTTINIAENEASVNLSINFDVQKKSVSDSAWASVDKGAFVTTSVDVGAIGEYVNVSENVFYRNTDTYTFDAREYIGAGANRVRVRFSYEDDPDVTTSITYVINVTQLYIEPLLNEWYNPIIEGGDESAYKLGGFRIIGSLSKTLHIDLYAGETKVRQFTDVLGTTNYDRIPYYFNRSKEFSLLGLSTGIYMVNAYLTSGELVTPSISYNIMYVASSDVATAQLVCVNNVADRVFNYTTNELFKYSIYNKGLSTGSPSYVVNQVVGTTPTQYASDTISNVTTGEQHSFVIPLAWITDDVNLSIQATMTFGNDQVVSIPLDNSVTFPPVEGADFFLNTAARSNSDTNVEKIINAMDKSQLTPVWEKMTWMNGIDGWITDDTGRKCLYVPAGASVSLSSTEFQFINGDGMTFEMCYRISNVTDYDETVISIANNIATDAFRGIRIRPTDITIHSSHDSTSNNDLTRGTKLMDEDVIHFVLTIYPNYNGNPNWNIVTGYINGCKNFQFSYDTGAQWAVEGPLVIGAERSDASVYSIRTYRSVLSEQQVQQNYINSIPDLADRSSLDSLLKSVMDSETQGRVDYESVKNSNKNFFVLEMPSGVSVPSRANGWTADTNSAAYATLEMHYGEHPEWDWKITDVETMGQGTTSMGYHRWNIRWRIDKSSNAKASYLDARTSRAGSYSYLWKTPETVSKINFDGEGRHPALQRITAKINFASSMQSHKMGATKAYTELHDAIGLENEAQEFAVDPNNNLPKPTVAVYQYPVYGFSRTGSTYEFIGLFTIGPDKGDAATFGYDIDNSIKSNLITMEGSDHNHSVVMFNYPWNSNMNFSASDEFLNATVYENNKRGGWEVSNCHGLKTSDASKQGQVNTVLETEFKPAYDVAFNNSTMIFPIALNEYGATAAATVEAINADTTFGATVRPGNRLANSNYQFWIEGEYVLYYLDVRTGNYTAGINLISDLGTPDGSTLDEKNEWFKAQRRARFMANAEDYWDIHDSIYHYCFMLLVGAVDNFGKNTYPYKMKTLAGGGRWKWRQDDLDSVLGINNAGADTVGVWSEFEDKYASGAAIYGGSPSVFWNLIHECYMADYVSTESNATEDGIRTTGKAIIGAMQRLAGGESALAGCLNYFKTRFWDNAQNYFPQSAYNYDAVFKYEDAWLKEDNQQAPPLPQSLGNHLSAEYLWVYNRIIYLMSLFRAGPFGANDSTLGQVVFRPIGLPSITVTPLNKMYPAVMDGETMRNGARTDAGVGCTLYGATGGAFSPEGQSNLRINASNYLTSFGDLCKLNVDTSLTSTLNIQGKKLIDFKIGDADSGEVETNVIALGFATGDNAPVCLEEVDARNADTITGAVDLSSCKRLKSALFGGSGVTQLKFANGQRIEEVGLSENTNNISMKNLRLLESSNITIPSAAYPKIGLMQIQNCAINPFTLLHTLYNTENSSLRNIDIISPDIQEVNLDIIHDLVGIAQNKDKDGNSVTFSGVTDAGAPSTANPRIEGTIQCTTGIVMSDMNALNLSNVEDYGTGTLKKGRLLHYGALDLIYDSNVIYIEFEDSAVEAICVSNWGSGGYITMAQAEAVTSLGSAFKANSNIQYFDELRYFSITSIGDSLKNCSSLKKLWIPATIGNSDWCSSNGMGGLTSLEELTMESPFHGIGSANFGTSGNTSDLNSLTRVNIKDLDTWLNSVWSRDDACLGCNTHEIHLYYIGSNTEITSIGSIPSELTSIKDRAFKWCTGITSVVIPSTITTIGRSAFEGCTSLASINIPSSVTGIGVSAFRGCASLTGAITIPSSVANIYESAFSGCGFTSVTLPSSYMVLGAYVFDSCSQLESVTLPPSVTLNTGFFVSCTSLASVTLTGPVSVSGNHVFRYCSNLKRMNIPNVGDWLSCVWSLTNNDYPTAASNEMHLYLNGSDSEITVIDNIPNTITSIGVAAFHGCKNLTSVTIPSSVTSIGSSAFSRCSSLTSFTIPSSVTTIGNDVFSNCSGLTSLTIPSTVTSLGEAIVTGCSGLKSLVVNCDVHSGLGLTAAGGTVGDGTGTMYIDGEYYVTTSGDRLFNFKKIIITGDLTVTYTSRPAFSNTSNKEIRIGGNVSVNNHSVTWGTSIKFIEVGGTVSATGSTNAALQNSGIGVIGHFKYNGVACKPGLINNANAANFALRWSKIYVDSQAVLDQYLADSDWSSDSRYTDALDLWSNYSGEYKD